MQTCKPRQRNTAGSNARISTSHASFLECTGFCDWFGVPFLGLKGIAAYVHASRGFYALIGWMSLFDAG
jgi:hypothetical protein